GGLIALYERAVGLYGSLVNINAYHQPGVEAGKKAAAVVLDLQKQVLQVLQEAKTPLSLAQIAEKAAATDQIEAIYKILRHLQANRRGVAMQGDPAHPESLTFSLS
ncbi:glucose-6-phosphate isomerase, partial [Chroococcidiopsidales cyanobacterium LEGE 13417]|nr:glucose-6-phosphate isomerase [Chroococcidiopsidales cyanobacterium LEGE 13417]